MITIGSTITIDTPNGKITGELIRIREYKNEPDKVTITIQLPNTYKVAVYTTTRAVIAQLVEQLPCKQ